MKIPLRVRNRFGWPAVYASTSIITKRFRPAKLLSLVDIGSPWTVITPSGADILNISTKHLHKPSKNQKVDLAGYTFNRFLLKDVNIYLVDETKKPTSFHMQYIGVLEPIEKINLTKFPEQLLLGCDFLSINKLELYFNPTTKIAFMNK